MRRRLSRLTFSVSHALSVVRRRSTVVGLAASVLLLTTLACNTLNPPRPAIEWDHSPEVVVVRGTYCCGLVPQFYAENYIPDVQIWGDGRIVWVEDLEGGARRVSEGHLTEAELAALLQRFVEAGFFGWADNYANYNVMDGATQCLRVSLLSGDKSVCEYYEGAPAAFHTLYRDAAQGAGAAGVEFVPAQGTLTIFPTNEPYQVTPEDYLDWDPAVTGLTLAEVTGPIVVEGNALALAWRAVNRGTWSPLVREQGAYYYLVVAVPGLNAP